MGAPESAWPCLGSAIESLHWHHGGGGGGGGGTWLAIPEGDLVGNTRELDFESSLIGVENVQK